MGALNVGSIVLDFDEEVVTNRSMPRDPYYSDKAYRPSLDSPLDLYLSQRETEMQAGDIEFAKGQMTGRFEMGSTIVLIYETPSATTETFIEEGDVVRLGQEIVRTKE